MNPFHPDLRLARWFPKMSFGPVTTALARLGNAPGRLPVLPDLTVEDVVVPAGDSPEVSLRLYRPKHLTDAQPALYWMHGGGYVMGKPEQDEQRNIAFARTLGITVAAVRYRLAPAHTAPAAVMDAHRGLCWLAENGPRLNIDPERIAIGGSSAGGGLAASLALYAHDHRKVRPVFQLLVHPMLDDRTVLRAARSGTPEALDTRDVRVWTPGSNAWAWSVYLGHAPGAPHGSPYAAPARRDDLRGLPPAWMGVGTLDLFHDEDLAYAKRLEESGVPCETHVVPGAFHAFDVVFPNAPVSQAFRAEQARALKAALFVDSGTGP